MLEKYKSLSSQAEEINTAESYKELVDIIKDMNYKDMYELFADVEVALEVILREGLPSTHRGIPVILERIVKLGQMFMAYHKGQYENIRYTYEFSENPKSKGQPPFFIVGGKQS